MTPSDAVLDLNPLLIKRTELCTELEMIEKQIEKFHPRTIDSLGWTKNQAAEIRAQLEPFAEE